MIENDILSFICKLKKNIKNEIKSGRIENVLRLISLGSSILFQTNYCYMDADFEGWLEKIASAYAPKEAFKQNEDIVVFYDGFGLNSRGLARIYLQALSEIKNVIYITYESRKNDIPDILDIVRKSGGKAYFIGKKPKSKLQCLNELVEVIQQIKPADVFFYSVPDDVIGVTALYALKDQTTRIQVNLTDHAFWLGAGCIDRCIEFRDYGARISNTFRKIPEEKITVIPFYPVIDKNMEFQGYPFELKENSAVVFSGGALYKTFGGDNKYYRIVDHILEKYPNAIFWYAGFGDTTEIAKLKNKYDGRMFFTGERSDLFQVLEKCRFYLSTYPISGGLMFQYAASAGKVPVTLMFDKNSDCVLINQDKLGIEFTDIQELYSEIDKLMTDDEYVKNREKQMIGSVITRELFDEKIKNLLNGNYEPAHLSDEKNVEDEQFKKLYVNNLSRLGFDALIVKTWYLSTIARFFPIRFAVGVMALAKRRFLKLNKTRCEG